MREITSVPGFGGHPVTASPFGGVGLSVLTVISPTILGTSKQSNLAASTFAEVDNPIWRRVVDLRAVGQVALSGLLASSPDALAAANKATVRYRADGDANGSSSTSAGAGVLVLSAGGHTQAEWFLTDWAPVPPDARVERCALIPGFYDGDGTGDPFYYACYLHFR